MQQQDAEARKMTSIFISNCILMVGLCYVLEFLLLKRKKNQALFTMLLLCVVPLIQFALQLTHVSDICYLSSIAMFYWYYKISINYNPNNPDPKINILGLLVACIGFLDKSPPLFFTWCQLSIHYEITYTIVKSDFIQTAGINWIWYGLYLLLPMISPLYRGIFLGGLFATHLISIYKDYKKYATPIWFAVLCFHFLVFIKEYYPPSVVYETNIYPTNCTLSFVNQKFPVVCLPRSKMIYYDEQSAIPEYNKTIVPLYPQLWSGDLITNDYYQPNHTEIAYGYVDIIQLTNHKTTKTNLIVWWNVTRDRVNNDENYWHVVKSTNQVHVKINDIFMSEMFTLSLKHPDSYTNNTFHNVTIFRNTPFKEQTEQIINECNKLSEGWSTLEILFVFFIVIILHVY